jgi:hypothetical protein
MSQRMGTEGGSGRDRRVDPRTPVRAPAVLYVGGKELGAVDIQDVSKSGVFVAHPGPSLPEHSRITLRMVVQNEEIDLAGEVVHVLAPDAAAGMNRTPGYGVRLVDPPADVVTRVASAGAQLAGSVGLKPTVVQRSDSKPGRR